MREGRDVLSLFLAVAKVTEHPVIPTDTTTWLSVIGVVISIITVAALVVYGRKYVTTQGVRAQMDAKDAIIGTNQQSIRALETRLGTLEEDFERVTNELGGARIHIRELDHLLAEQQRRYQELRAYSAPEAMDAIQHLLAEQAAQFNREHREILKAIEHVVELVERIAGSIN